MGMFDVFNSISNCPKCTVEQQFEFQTKVLFNDFTTFNQGEVVESYNMIAKDGKYPGFAYCDKCNTFFWGDIVIENHTFQKIENLKIDEPYLKWNIEPKENDQRTEDN